MPFEQPLYPETLDWLLNSSQPGVRYLALRDLAGIPIDDPKVLAAQKAAHTEGPIANLLNQMDPTGYWERPGPGYSPKYRSIVWVLLTLAQLGARADLDPRIAQACTYYLDHAFTPEGQIAYNGKLDGTFDCLQGNMLWSLLEMGYSDPRIDKAFDWMARSNTGEGVEPASAKNTSFRYALNKVGPDFQCRCSDNLSCAWGCVKALLAFGKLPTSRHTPVIKEAIQRGVNFLFRCDPADADYPSTSEKNSPYWWKFSFPLFYTTDILQLAEALAAHGLIQGPRLVHTLDTIQEKANPQGRWLQEHIYSGRVWVTFGPLNKPSPWVTLRALRILKAAGRV